jgi:hypothetical protein
VLYEAMTTILSFITWLSRQEVPFRCARVIAMADYLRQEIQDYQEEIRAHHKHRPHYGQEKWR